MPRLSDEDLKRLGKIDVIEESFKNHKEFDEERWKSLGRRLDVKDKKDDENSEKIFKALEGLNNFKTKVVAGTAVASTIISSLVVFFWELIKWFRKSS